MTAVSERKAEEPAQWCLQCGGAGEVGYRDIYGVMRWFCARHRLAQFWADARMPAIVTNNGGVLTDAPSQTVGGAFPVNIEGLAGDDMLLVAPHGSSLAPRRPRTETIFLPRRALP
jgi:hypothetical protein